MEIKVKRDHAERLRIKLGFKGLFYVDSVGLSGGLALLWRKNNTARLLSLSKNHVDVENVIGDFSDLLYQSEKQGRVAHPENLFRRFGEALDDSSLVQLPTEGYPYTWERGSGTEAWVEERLDRVVATAEWCNLLEGARVVNLLTRTSDHSALFIGISSFGEGSCSGSWGFRFEMALLLDDGCRGVVEKAWEDGGGVGLINSSKFCGDRLRSWGGDRIHMFGRQIKLLNSKLLQLRGRTDPASFAEFNDLEAQLRQLETQEDVYWRQRAKQH
ncbi:PREDICTED: uncharacterized protein LOC109152484 [Ipomoea nil]|uniref:uncharacterized protein LOC109152484 n=1 Tax=Ipomoea nil TaxID=35883 RepID=UPI000901D8F4|nr:PREDICTED: uncharacterized protein LOC109152484 [Ipomoea nil]